jgi:Uncharacterized low-complexity proteins
LGGEAGGRRADLRRANLRWANLSGAKLREANMIGADLSRANMIGADLSRANMIGADLFGANLSEADLSRADLSCADLSRAILSRADLSRAILSRADLSEADLRGATMPWGAVHLGGEAMTGSAGGYWWCAHLATDGVWLAYGCEQHPLAWWRGQTSDLSVQHGETREHWRIVEAVIELATTLEDDNAGKE